jgi:NADH-quinone oxidoreductase subunit I
VAVDEKDITYVDPRLERARRMGVGVGLLKGLAVTFKHLFKRNTVIEYPDEKQDLPPRTRGVIALKEENCTVCMLCSRECPDWCIYIESHKEELPPKRAGGRKRKRNVLDRFAIDYALCMYCGICVEVCPYDALFWSREFEYAEYDIRALTHEKERLSDWMATVLPPPPLEVGAELPGAPGAEVALPERPAPRVSSPAARASAPAPAPAEAAPAVPEPATAEPLPGPKRASEPEPAAAGPVPAPAPAEDPQAVYDAVLKEQLERGSSPQVAEARAKVARVKAERGIARPGVPPPMKAPETAESGPGQTPAVPAPEADRAPATERLAGQEAAQAAEDPEAVYERVLAEERAKGSSEAVAQARAKAARMRAIKGAGG